MNAVTVHVEEPVEFGGHALHPGDEAHVHVPRGSALLSQRIRVLAVSVTTPGEFTFEPVGEQFESDRRKSRRTEVARESIFADFEDELGCEVLELNDSGFSIVGRDRHIPGAIGALSVHFDGQLLSGFGAVRSARPQQDGSTIYGIQVMAMAGTQLADSMPDIHAALQQRGIVEQP